MGTFSNKRRSGGRGGRVAHERGEVDLAETRLRQLAPELDVAGARPLDQARAAVRDQLSRVDRGPILQDDEGLDALALSLVGSPDHASFGDRWMLDEHGFDLRRVASRPTPRPACP